MSKEELKNNNFCTETLKPREVENQKKKICVQQNKMSNMKTGKPPLDLATEE